MTESKTYCVYTSWESADGSSGWDGAAQGPCTEEQADEYIEALDANPPRDADGAIFCAEAMTIADAENLGCRIQPLEFVGGVLVPASAADALATVLE